MSSISKSALRALDVLILLKGKSLQGLSNAEISKALACSPVNISRALAALEEKGLVIKLETGRYAHSVTMMQIACAHADELTRAEHRIGEIRQRVAAGAMH